MQSGHLSASCETQHYPNAMIQREELWETKKVAAENQKEETPSVIPLTPIKN